MSLIDRYIAEVGRNLPEKDRTDIEAEIRSMLEDMVDERIQGRVEAAKNSVISETLEELGDPRLLAAKYSPPRRYLIGPAWYDVYLKTLQRVLFTALPVFAAVVFLLTLMENPLAFGDAMEKVLSGAFEIGVQILFWVTLVFILLERSDEVPPLPQNRKSYSWTIAQLPLMPRKRQISIAETVMNIAVNLFLLLWIALPVVIERVREDSEFAQFLHPGLWSFWLPLFFVLAGLNLIHEIFKLRIGNWTPALTITNIILGIASIVYLTALVTTQDIINPAFLSTLDIANGERSLRETVEWSIYISAAIIAGIYIWDMLNSILMARQLQQNH